MIRFSGAAGLFYGRTGRACRQDGRISCVNSCSIAWKPRPKPCPTRCWKPACCRCRSRRRFRHRRRASFVRRTGHRARRAGLGPQPRRGLAARRRRPCPDHGRGGRAGPALFQDWSLRDVPDADWVRLTQSQFGPIQVAERLWIVPSWHRDNPDVPGLDLDAADGAIHIELDPGLAFGTGSHPTTHLCLAWLEAELPAGATLLDYGCGSGILAIARAQAGRGAAGGGHRSASRAEHRVQRPGQRRRAGRHAARRPEGRHVPGRGRQYPVEPAEGAGAHAGRPRRCRRATGALGVLERQAEEVAAAYAPVDRHVGLARARRLGLPWL